MRHLVRLAISRVTVGLSLCQPVILLRRSCPSGRARQISKRMQIGVRTYQTHLEIGHRAALPARHTLSPYVLARAVVKKPFCCYPPKEVLQHRTNKLSPRMTATEQSGPSSRLSDARTNVLFVCLGNICRSPAAEAVFRDVVDRAGLTEEFNIDSCGTGGGVRNWYKGAASYHEGGPADERMMDAASKRGIDITSVSRPLRAADLSTFDYIIGMDYENLAAIQVAADFWSLSQPVPKDYRKRVQLICNYLRNEKFRARYREVPDPYWGGDSGFSLVLDLLEDACKGLLAKIQEEKKNSSNVSI